LLRDDDIFAIGQKASLRLTWLSAKAIRTWLHAAPDASQRAVSIFDVLIAFYANAKTPQPSHL